MLCLIVRWIVQKIKKIENIFLKFLNALSQLKKCTWIIIIIEPHESCSKNCFHTLWIFQNLDILNYNLLSKAVATSQIWTGTEEEQDEREIHEITYSKANTALHRRLSSALQSQVFPMTSLRLYSFTQQQRATLTNINGFSPLIPFLYTDGVSRPRFQ